MRHSSMKSIVASLTISVTMLAAAPALSAAPAPNARQQQSSAREAGRDTDRIAAVRQFINRTIRRIAAQSGITVPIPKSIEPENP